VYSVSQAKEHIPHGEKNEDGNERQGLFAIIAFDNNWHVEQLPDYATFCVEN
jgi:hypothetical protein